MYVPLVRLALKHAANCAYIVEVSLSISQLERHPLNN